jgi:hypothetical protein
MEAGGEGDDRGAGRNRMRSRESLNSFRRQAVTKGRRRRWNRFREVEKSYGT